MQRIAETYTEGKKIIDYKQMKVKQDLKNVSYEKCNGNIRYQFCDVTYTLSSSQCNIVDVDLAIHAGEETNNKVNKISSYEVLILNTTWVPDETNTGIGEKQRF